MSASQRVAGSESNVFVVDGFVVHVFAFSLYFVGHGVAQSVEALRYKPEDLRGCSLEFFIDIIVPAALWPWG